MEGDVEGEEEGEAEGKMVNIKYYDQLISWSATSTPPSLRSFGVGGGRTCRTPPPSHPHPPDDSFDRMTRFTLHYVPIEILVREEEGND